MIPFWIQQFAWNSDMFLLLVFIFTDNMYLPTSAIDWMETSVRENTSSADVLEADKKAYCAEADIVHNLISVICRNVLSWVQINRFLLVMEQKMPSKL
jgi:hypothetical protein